MNNFVCECHNQEFRDRTNLISHLWYERVKNSPEYVQKAKKNHKIWYEKNKNTSEYKEKIKLWNLKNPNFRKEFYERIKNTPEYKEQVYQDYIKNKEKYKERDKKAYQKIRNNPILWVRHQRKVKEYSKNCYERVKNTLEFKEKQKEYNNSPRGKSFNKVYDVNRRTNLKDFSKLTIEKLQQVYENNIKKYGTLTCELCFNPILFGQDALEHFIPVSRIKEFPEVDLNSLGNLGIVHGQYSKENCNGHKSDKTLKEWFQDNPKHLIKETNKNCTNLVK